MKGLETKFSMYWIPIPSHANYLFALRNINPSTAGYIAETPPTTPPNFTTKPFEHSSMIQEG